MMIGKKTGLLGFVVILFIISGCQSPVESESIATVVDPCAPEQLRSTAKPLDTIQRAFDDAVQVAANVQLDEIQEHIAILQSYRRQVADLDVPVCMEALKNKEVDYMNSMINAFIAFQEGAPTEVINAALDHALNLQASYDEELSGLLGATLTPRPTAIQWTPEAIELPTEVVVATSTPQQASESNATPAPFTSMAVVINPPGANIHLDPNLFSSYPVIVSAGEKVLVVARSEDGEWLLILHDDMPESYGWVFAPLVELQVPLDEIPVAELVTETPTP